jgi:hypothetical protein
MDTGDSGSATESGERSEQNGAPGPSDPPTPGPPLPEPPPGAAPIVPPPWPSAEPTPEAAPTVPMAWPPAGVPGGVSEPGGEPPAARGKRTIILVAALLIVLAGGAIAAVALLGGNSPSKPKAGQPTLAAGPKVTGIQATPVSAIEVDLTWTATGPVQLFYVYRNGNVLSTESSSTMSYKDLSLAPNRSYTYAVEAADSAGNRSDRAETMARTLPPPPLADARLQGQYIIRAKYLSENFTNKSVGQVETQGWRFQPTCAHGPCRVRLNLFAPGQTPTILARKGAEYDGSGAANIGKCGSSKITETLTIAVHITRARFIEGVWMATAIAGTFKQYAPPNFSCQSGSAVQSITGSLQS